MAHGSEGIARVGAVEGGRHRDRTGEREREKERERERETVISIPRLSNSDSHVDSHTKVLTYEHGLTLAFKYRLCCLRSLRSCTTHRLAPVAIAEHVRAKIVPQCPSNITVQGSYRAVRV
jgi:hypothetical protein